MTLVEWREPLDSVTHLVRGGALDGRFSWEQNIVPKKLHRSVLVKLFFCASAQAGILHSKLFWLGGLMYASQKFTGTLALVTPGTEGSKRTAVRGSFAALRLTSAHLHAACVYVRLVCKSDF